MADTKITGLLSPQVTTNPATDVLPIVNIADTLMASSGSTRKITVNQLLGAGGTATLASATITGDLTVRTNKLSVTSNGVGIGTATPTAGFALDIQTAAGTAARIKGGSGSGQGSAYYVTLAASASTLMAIGDRANIFGGTPDTTASIYTGSGIPLTFDVGGSTAMTLNSTGLGVGVTPSAWSSIYKVYQIGQSASVSGGSSVELAVFGSNCYFDTTDSRWERITSGFTSQYYQTNGTHVWRIGGTAAANTDCSFTNAMTLDASGRLLVGTSNAAVTADTGCRLLLNNGATGHFTVAVTTNQSTAATSCYDFYSTSAGEYRFYVTSAGTVFATNTTISPITSDERLKQNIVDYDKGLEEVLALRPRHFEYKAEPNRKLAGFISQEVKTVIPDAIRPTLKDPEMMTYEIDWYPLLVKAIQELTARVQTLEAR